MASRSSQVARNALSCGSATRQSGISLPEIVIFLAFVGIIAAIVWPSYCYIWTAASNEAQALGDTRSLQSAQVVYSANNCGWYAAELRCLTQESESGVCIPGYPADAPDFLGSDLAREVPYVKSGYERDYRGLGRPTRIDDSCDPASWVDYCYSSRPSSPGLSGERTLVGTGEGLFYVEPAAGVAPCDIPPSERVPVGG